MAETKKYLQGMELFGGAKMKISSIVMRDLYGEYFMIDTKSGNIRADGLKSTVLGLHDV
jgi:hypothetical protein